MSDDGKDRERTIIVRQSPLSQIRRAGPPPSPTPAPAAPPQPAYPQRDSAERTQFVPFSDSQADAFGPQNEAAPPPLQQRTVAAAPPLQGAQMPRELNPEIEAETTMPPLAVRNPLVWLASRILVRLAGMRTGQMLVTTQQFHAEMIEATNAYRDALNDIGYDKATVDNATYAVAATVDDVMQNIPSTQGFEWARRSMVVHVFNENIGGDRFWATVDDILRRPSGKEEVLELFHACVAAGFLGKYRLTGREDRGLSDRMAAMHAELARSIQKTGDPLAPHWKGVVAPARKMAFWGPLIAFAALCGCILLGLYAYFLLTLGNRTDTIGDQLTALNGAANIVIERTTPPPPADEEPPPITSTRLQRIRTALADEIGNSTIAVDVVGARIKITTQLGALFEPGSDQLDPQNIPYVKAIAESLEPERCRIQIVGHTDSDPVSKGLKFPDNQSLSEARALTAKNELAKYLSDPNRIDTEGRGATQPIPGATKALNRRIEFFVPLREDE